MRVTGMVSRWVWLAPALALLVGACRLRHLDLTADRLATAPAAGVHTVVVTSGAGWLRIQGHAGFDRIQARGIAHASSERFLAATTLTITRRGDTVFVAASTPADTGTAAGPPGLDLTVDVPAEVALDVTDASGETIVHDVGPLRIATSGSGGVEIDGVGGALDATDGPGDFQAANVHGDVHIRDGSGAIYLSNIAGNVDIPTDGAGEVQVADVTGSVHVGSKSSGEVAARNVGGDLLVDATGSGSVEYHDVKGRVGIPGRH
jgi:hypothetical protein